MASTVDAIVYVGVHDEVEVPAAGYLVARRDTPIQVGNEPGQVREADALTLLEQSSNWAKAPSAKAEPKGKVTS